MLLVGQGVVPERPAVARNLPVDGVPGELEPLVEEREDHAPGQALLLEHAQDVGVDLHGLGLAVRTLVAPEGAVVGASHR